MDMFEKLFVYKWKEKTIVLLSLTTAFFFGTTVVAFLHYINELANQIK